MSDSNDETKIAVLENEMKHLNLTAQSLVEKLDSLHAKLDDNYVKKSDFAAFLVKEFEPVKSDVKKLDYFYVKVLAVAGAIAFSFIYLPGVLKTILQGITK